MVATCVRDITEGFQDCAIVHCCNCFHTMGTGVALVLRMKWPQVFEADLKSELGSRKKLGSFTMSYVDNGNVVYNLYGQHRYGRGFRQLNYEAIYSALEGAIINAKPLGKNALVVPFMMGCNNAGGDWRIMSQMLEVLAEKYEITIWVCQKP